MKQYDVLIVGTGASGGLAAKVLTEHGLEVLLLESGPAVKASQFKTHAMPYHFPFRGVGSPRRIRNDGPRAASEYTPFPGYYAEFSQHPYTTPPDQPWDWSLRSRILGGRTLHWGRQSFRLAEYDFKGASIDGQGADWPFTYDQLAPYYDKVEDYIGVQGRREGLSQIPDGIFQPAFAFGCYEHLMRKAARKMGWRMTSLRVAQLSRPHRKRPACHCCGACGHGCHVNAFFSTVAVTLPDALATGKLTLRTDAVVRHVVVDSEGRAKGVGFFDRATTKYEEVSAKVVVLAASTLESTRIMLNSTSRVHPNGLANSSGVLGHYLTDHFTAGSVVGLLPELVGSKIRNDDGTANASYIPRFRNVGGRHPDFLRGYSIMVRGGSQIFPSHATMIPGFGAEYKQQIKKNHPAWAIVYARGEPLQTYESHVKIDPNVVDAWGIPVLHIRYQRTENDRKMLRDAFRNLQELMGSARAEILSADESLSTPGAISHEMGTCRMGLNAKTSVLNAYNQAHDVKNLFVMDGGCWPSSTCQNPTQTMLAIAWRASDYLAEQARKGNL
ncbi:MAG TPA: GMC family oxidoreductase [Bryobacteraceae bacterium]|nr:GMC family oxidoreductase [Bryobacteraceae bacterium]